METNELYGMIDEYFDDELDKSKESALFLSLSSNEDARNYFKGHHLLKTVTGEIQDEFPRDLERNILAKTISYEKNGFGGQKVKPFLVYASILVFFFLSLFFYNETNSYKSDIENISYKLREQNRTIESILNSLPAAEVKGVRKDEIKEIKINATKL